MGVVIKSYRTKVSSYADKDGNFRAINPDDHPGFVGYGRTPDEAMENWKRTVSERTPASLLAYAEAAFMILSEADQQRFLVDLSGLRRS